MESAAIGGAAHLVNFMSTDTIVAIPTLMKYYGATPADFFMGTSIPASEHRCCKITFRFIHLR